MTTSTASSPKVITAFTHNPKSTARFIMDTLRECNKVLKARKRKQHPVNRELARSAAKAIFEAPVGVSWECSLLEGVTFGGKHNDETAQVYIIFH